jgi:flagellin
MGLRINQNIGAMNAYRNLTATDGQMSKSLEKLSSGFRINRAADDAAGLSISEGLRSQVGGLKVAVRNAQDGISVVQTAEGALTEVHSMLQRTRELAVQWSNGTLSDTDRRAIVSEVRQLTDEIGRIGRDAQFNNIRLLDTAVEIRFQVGANDGEQISVRTVSLATEVGTIDITAADPMRTIDTAIERVSAARSTFGAVQNRLEHTYNNLSTYQENLSASESRIRDVDMAAEMVNFTKNNILQQAGTSMLAQAQQAPQAVLSLLR